MSALLDEVMDWARKSSAPPTEQEMIAMRADAALMASAFTGEDGRRRLMVMARMTMLRPHVDAALSVTGDTAYAHQRVGQNSIFAALVRYLDIHEAALKEQTDERRPRDADPDPHARPGPVAGPGVALRRTVAGDAVDDERFTGDAGFDPAGLVGGR